MSKKDTFVPSITLEQVQKIKSRIAEAIKEYGKTVIDKEAYAKATEGLKYKSSNGQKVYLVVPTRSQKKKIQNEYLRGIQIEFNKNHKLHYQLKFAGFNKSKLWIPALLGGLATTGGATGAAVYFALQEGGGTPVPVGTVVVTLSLDGGEISSHPGEGSVSLDVVPNETKIGDLPTPTKTGFNFTGWENTATNEPLSPEMVITEGMNLNAIYEAVTVTRSAMGGSTTLTAPFGQGGEDTGNAWKPYIDGKVQPTTGCTYDFVETEHTGISISTAGIVSWGTSLTAGTHTVHVRIKDAQQNTYDSDEIKITISDAWELKPGKDVEVGVYGVKAFSADPTTLFKNGTEIALQESNLSIDEADTYNVDFNPSGNMLRLRWNNEELGKQDLPVGDNTLHINAIINSEVVATCIVHVVIKEAPVDEPIIITGDTIVNATDPDVAFKAATYPGGVDKTADVTWSAAWKTTTHSGTLPTFDNQTAGAKGKMTTFADTNGVVTVSAKDSSGAVLATFDTTVQPPYIDSDGIWGKFGTGTSAKWGKFTLSTLTAATGSIKYTPIGGTETELSDLRTAFSQELYIGNDLTSIPNNFLNGCTGFKSQITFDANSKCTYIGDNFIAGDASAATPIIMGFDQPLTLPASVEVIGNRFLADCPSFVGGASFALPTGLQRIGDDFLYNCTSFDASFTLGTSITTIGNEFMFGCDSMTGTITIDTPYDNFMAVGAVPMSFATLSEDPEWKEAGINITTTTGQDLAALKRDLFPDAAWVADAHEWQRKLTIV